MNDTPPKLDALDGLRGVAVMGILLMNIVGFALPDAAYLNPDAIGASTTDRLIWTVQFVLIDGKMRGLFALLFGIGILLAADAADRRGQDAALLHLRRMAALLAIGVVHFYGFWTGDILTDYAIVGVLALFWRHASATILLSSAIVMFAGSLMIEASFVADLARIDADAARAPLGSNAQQLWTYYNGWLGWPTATQRTAETASHSLGWWTAAALRIRNYGWEAITGDLGFRLEVLGFMLSGMAVHRSGLILNEHRARRIGLAFATIGLARSAVLAWQCWTIGFAPVETAAVVLAWSLPPRILLTLAWLGLLAGWVQRSTGGVATRVRAAGRMALSNYLGATLLFTALFDGWGLGFYGQLSRPMLLITVLAAWIVMLIWSPLWLSRFALGPAEWLWRSLAAGRFLPISRNRLATASQ